MEELFNTKFMSKYTNHPSFYDFLVKSNLISNDTKEITQEIFTSIPDKGFNDYIKKTTKFSSWEQMQQTAISEYTTYNPV